MCTRFVTASLVRRRETCALTVASLMNSEAAISALDAPDPTALATSRSRSVSDAMRWGFGPGEVFAPRFPGLKGAVELWGEFFPVWQLVTMTLGPLVWLGLHLLLTRTRFGQRLRAATMDRAMLDALGVNPKPLMLGAVMLGCALAGLGGALQLPREPANLQMDVNVIVETFVVVVTGGLGSIGGAFFAALLIGLIQTFAVAINVSLADVIGRGAASIFGELGTALEQLHGRITVISSPPRVAREPSQYPWLWRYVSHFRVGAAARAVQHAKLWAFHWKVGDEEQLDLHVSSTNLTPSAFKAQVQAGWQASVRLSERATVSSRCSGVPSVPDASAGWPGVAGTSPSGTPRSNSAPRSPSATR